MSPLGNKVTICFHITFDPYHSLMFTVTCEWEFQRLFNNSSSKFFVVSSDVRKKFPKLARLVSLSFSVHISYKYIADKATRIYVYKFKDNLIKSCIHIPVYLVALISYWLIDCITVQGHIKPDIMYNGELLDIDVVLLMLLLVKSDMQIGLPICKHTTILCPSTSFAFSSSFITFSFLSLN